MKKIVVILLLVLPFVLIYSISFTGRILAEYTHVYVERLALLDEENNEYPQGHVITLGRGEEYTLQVKVFPELASNQEFTVSNSNKTVCEIDEKTKVVKALDYGVSDIVLTSKDRPIAYAFRVRVFDADIQEIQVNKTELTLTEGQTEEIRATVLPSTTLPENRNLLYESADENVAKINANGLVTAIRAGETTVTIRSNYKEDVFTTVKVIVLETVIDPVIAFNVDDSMYEISQDTLDLRPLTIINVDEYTNLKYEVVSNVSGADQSRIGEGIVIFKREGVYQINASLVYREKTYKATLKVLFLREDDIQSIEPEKTELTLYEGQTDVIAVTVLPSTTLPENRNLLYESTDENIAKINANGLVTAVSEGETTITVRSDYKTNVYATVKVTVIKVPVVSFNTVIEQHQISEPTLNLRALTIITVADYTDLTYEVITNASDVDESKISEGIVTFLKYGLYKINVSLVYAGERYTATLTVFYHGE